MWFDFPPTTIPTANQSPRHTSSSSPRWDLNASESFNDTKKVDLRIHGLQKRFGKFNLGNCQIDSAHITNRRPNRDFKRDRFTMKSSVTDTVTCTERSVIAAFKQTLDFVQRRNAIEKQFKVIGLQNRIRTKLAKAPIDCTPQVSSMIIWISGRAVNREMPPIALITWAVNPSKAMGMRPTRNDTPPEIRSISDRFTNRLVRMHRRQLRIVRKPQRGRVPARGKGDGESAIPSKRASTKPPLPYSSRITTKVYLYVLKGKTRAYTFDRWLVPATMHEEAKMTNDLNKIFKTVRASVYKSLHDWTEAEEIAQAALVTAVVKYGESHQKLAQLVSGIARNLVKRFFAKRKKQLVLVAFNQFGDEFSPTSRLHRGNADRNQRRILYRIISGFENPSDRKIAKLYCLGYSARKSADLLWIAHGSVAPAINRIKKQLSNIKDFT